MRSEKMDDARQAWASFILFTGLIVYRRALGIGRWSLIVVIILLGQPNQSLAQSSPEPVVLESNENGLHLAWAPPAYGLTELEVEGVTYSQIQMPATTPSAQPGYPELPLCSSLIGLPATGGAQLRLVEVEREVVQLPHPPLPAPVPQPLTAALIDSGHTPPTAGPALRRPDPASYAADSFYPATVAELGPVQQVGRQRVARLVLYPLRVNPVTGQMEVIRHLRLEIDFDQPASIGGDLGGQAGSTPFGQALAATLLNPQAGRWAGPAPEPALGAESMGPLSTEQTVKVTVEQAGLYALTYQELAGADLPVGTLDPRTLQLSHGWPRQEVAIQVEGENDGQFNSGDRLLFYAEPAFSRYGTEDLYFLSYGQGSGLRMDSRPANPTGPAGVAWRTSLAAGTNQFYDSHYPGHDGDHWYWEKLSQAEKTEATYSIELEAPLTTGPNALLTLRLESYTDPVQDPDHRLAASVNGLPVGEQTWNGAQAIEATFSVPAAGLAGGTNEVQLSLPGLSGITVEATWLDSIALTYPIGQGGDFQLIFQGEAGQKSYSLAGWPSNNLKVYDITDPVRPRFLTGHTIAPNGPTYSLTLGDAETTPARYLATPQTQIRSPGSIRPLNLFNDPPGGADYIIITHPDFAGAIDPLATYRAAQGLRVVTVEVQAIYDTFGPGRMDPAAIKRFLHHAYTTWAPPAPTYVLLVGDGSYDFKNHSGYNPQTFIPPYLAPVDPWWGETAADNRFVTVAGEDPLPDMLIGRLAVNSPAETATVVDKIIQYESNPTPGGWNVRHLFVSDNPDSAGNYHSDADQGYNQLQAPFVGQRFYYGSGSEPHIYDNVDTLRTTFLNTFNQGAGLVIFHGHSSWLQWAVEGILRYYPYPYSGPNDLTGIHNQYRLPVVLEMTCFTGSFHIPYNDTLDESLLNLTGGGAVGVWGSTGLGISTGHVSLQTGFYRTIQAQGQPELGAAALAGKMELYGTGFHQDLLDTFTLFGDPALKMNFTPVPFSNQRYLPIVFH